ncbi:MAG: hypothetical protein CMJ31_11365 [Phycisphaerae bacterium]|nr:hypothetical protein [Phycisphaerae bacterium]
MPETQDAAMWIEYAVIAGYLAFLIAIGVVFARFNRDVSDYFRNGCRGTWWLVGSSAFMQMFSAWTFTGAAGAAFESGWSVMMIFAANVLAFFLVFLFLGPWYRQLRAITAPEVIRMRFGPVTQQAYAWLQGALGVLYAAVWLWGLATFTAAVFDFTALSSALGWNEVQFVIVVTGLIVVVYSVAGGSWAVMATDFVQSLILIPLTLLVAFLCLREIGGVGGMFDEIQRQGLSERFQLINSADEFPLGKYGLAFAIATILYKTVAYSTLITAQKYFGVKDGAEARKAGLLACLLMAGGMFVWFIPPVVARLTMGDEVLAMDMSKPAEASYALIAVRLLPVGLTGLIVVAMLAATMSSMDSGLNRNAGVFIRDIEPLFRKLLKLPEATPRANLLMSRIVSIVLGVIIIGLALYFSGADGEGVFEAMLNIGALVALPMAIPMFLALFIRRVPGWAGLASVAAATVPSAIGFFAGKPLFQSWFAGGSLDPLLTESWSYQRQVFINVAVGVGAFVATIPFWKTAGARYRAHVDAFFTRMHTPVDFEKEVGQANDGNQLRVIGVFAMLIGGFVGLLMVIPGNDLAGRLSILFVAASVAGVGALLFFAGRRQLDVARGEPAQGQQRNDVPAATPIGESS